MARRPCPAPGSNCRSDDPGRPTRARIDVAADRRDHNRAKFARMILAILLATTPAEALHTVIDQDWAWRMEEFPAYASSAGHHEHDARLGHVDEGTQQHRLATLKQRYGELQAVDRSQLSQDDRVNAAVLAEILHSEIAKIEMHEYLVPMKGDESFFAGLLQMWRGGLFRNSADYEKYIAKMNDVPRFFEENLALMRQGLKIGFTAPQVVLKGKDGTALQIAQAQPIESPFYKPFKSMPNTMPRPEQQRLQKLAEATIRDRVLPAYARVAAFLKDEYIPRARTTIAASALPDGKAFYASQIREYVTEDRTPDEIHALGLSEVKRIRA